MRGSPRASDVRMIGASGCAVYTVVLDRYAGSRGRYTLWRLPIDGSRPTAEVLGRELPLRQCRSIAKEAGAR